ncbi:MAG: TldD/PmbA family protein [Undibacterium sp.]|nr:TldD/PmbA family protein [Opitutaceae bacterium]
MKKVPALPGADEGEANLSGGHTGNLRFARNAVSTSGAADTLSLAIQSSFGKKTGTATINEFDDASLEKVMRRSEELARLAPENPEHVEFMGPQKFLVPAGYVEATAKLTPDDRANAAAASLKVCRDQGMAGAGFLEDSTKFSAIANTRGLAGYQRLTDVNFSVTTRTAEGKGSGYALCDFNDAAKLDTAAVTTVAARKAAVSREARAIEPGKYTVILEPAAGIDLVSLMVSSMDARQADEGRSFLSKPGGSTRLGEKLVDERVQLYSDPMNSEIPGDQWAGDGRARARTDWIKDGAVANLAYSRYWARKNGKGDGTPPAGGRFVMAGGSASLDELIRGVKRGVLVTRLWYIRAVDPQTLLYTGLTRDGTFYVENGEIKYAVKNFRFNESPVIMLNNLEALGRPQRVSNSLIPPMVLRDFTFSSLSDAV